ncbi:spore germination protein GerPB [Effusibacillus pohliae]|uniref:spore germination protein GerPB n=1 Tax=Effusibacillus pohliae TaxID=232270 RepID=UPI0003776A15|nr:spore germination protein GerPB [Effusibacillus pohliae]
MKIVQTIHIGTFTINSIGGASIIQIGSSGMIRSYSESYETTEAVPAAPAMPAPQPPLEPGVITEVGNQAAPESLPS